MKIYYTNRFLSSYKKLPGNIKIKAEIKEKIFRNDPYEASLKTHKLTGKLRGFWAYSITRKYRIIFEFIKENNILFHNAGTHDIYR